MKNTLNLVASDRDNKKYWEIHDDALDRVFAT